MAQTTWYLLSINTCVTRGRLSWTLELNHQFFSGNSKAKILNNMAPSSTPFIVLLIVLLITLVSSEPTKKKVVNVEIGGHCDLGAAPVGPGGSWQVVEKDVEKVCAKGSSCRTGACNCDDLRDGTVTGQSVNAQGNRVCKRVAGQKCSSDSQCFQDVKCLSGVCTCDKSKKDFDCVAAKNDITILA
ncbi:unnamed protein product [Orchesella dallaii]|uniref:EB domain-containing protein n=1 Tax=Orchesella dallaii TaxID=48710 RepID=A0ABP1Q1K1_9HEXA